MGKINPILLAVVVICLSSLLLACNGAQTKATVPPAATTRPNPTRGSSSQAAPSNTKIEAAKEEMGEWAEGRWSSYSVTWSESNNRVLLSVIASPGANQVAVNGYCGILKDIARDFFSGHDVSGGVSVSGDITVC